MNELYLNLAHPSTPNPFQLESAPALRVWPPQQQHSPSFRTEPFTPPALDRKKFNNFEELEETPGFSTEFARLCFDHEESSERYMPVNLGSVTHSEAPSQGSNSESASIMQNINRNFKRNFKHLLLRRLKNRLEEVKAIHSDLHSSLREQADFTSASLQRIAAEVGRWTKKAVEQATNPLVQQIAEKEIAVFGLEAKLKERDQEMGRLKKELEREQEKARVAQKTMTKKTSYESRSSLAEQCSNCRVLEIKNATLKEEVLRAEKQIDSLASDNEQLHEQLFDMEQQIVGIDLEVERRLSDSLKSLDQLHSPRQEREDYLQIVRRLNDENGQLQEKYERLERQCLKEHELREWEDRLQAQEQDYQRKETSLLESLAAHQKHKEKLYDKQHDNFVAQEALMAKMNDLRKKEEELASWEALVNKSRSKLDFLLPSVEHRMEPPDDPTTDQPNLNSFGKIQEAATLKHPKPTTKTYERTQSEYAVFIPPLPLRETDHRQRIKTQFVAEDELQGSTPRTDWRHYAPHPRRTEKERREASPGHDLLHKPAFKYANTPASPQNYRDASKNSRMSAGKSARGPVEAPKGVRGNVSTVIERRERVQAAGLSSKLDKLRLEIKRQMEAIR